MEHVNYKSKTYTSPQEAAADLYLNGTSVARIAYILGCSETTVYNHLRKAGIARRPGSGRQTWKRNMRRFFKSNLEPRKSL